MLPSPSQPEVLLVATGRHRARPLAEPDWPQADPTLDQLTALVAHHPGAWGWTLTGGDPCLRPDLLDLIEALHTAGATNLGLATPGWALLQTRTVELLVARGLRRVLLPLATARTDANDWLAADPGATRRVRRALEVCAAAGMQVTLCTRLTRPTLPHLVETVEVAAALGAAGIRLERRPVEQPTEAIALEPRISALAEHLPQAVQIARRRGLQIAVHGLPACALPGVDDARTRPGAVRLVVAPDADWQAARAAHEPVHAQGCATCPADCPGPTAAYVQRFGRAELDVRPGPASYAPTEPATGVVRVRLDPHEPTRVGRTRLVAAIQERPATLELVGWLTHPERASLIPELRLLEPSVVLVDPVDQIASFTDRILGRLAGVATFDVAWLGPTAQAHDAALDRPGAHAAARSVIDRLEQLGAQVRHHARVAELPPTDEDRRAWQEIATPSPQGWRDPTGEPHGDEFLR